MITREGQYGSSLNGNNMSSKVNYQVDSTGLITSYQFDPEEGQTIVRMVGNVYEFTQGELKSMGIELDDRF
jgi:hypothetical protein